jgi:hypothetical protein
MAKPQGKSITGTEPPNRLTIDLATDCVSRGALDQAIVLSRPYPRDYLTVTHMLHCHGGSATPPRSRQYRPRAKE